MPYSSAISAVMFLTMIWGCARNLLSDLVSCD